MEKLIKEIQEANELLQYINNYMENETKRSNSAHITLHKDFFGFSKYIYLNDKAYKETIKTFLIHLKTTATEKLKKDTAKLNELMNT